MVLRRILFLTIIMACCTSRRTVDSFLLVSYHRRLLITSTCSGESVAPTAMSHVITRRWSRLYAKRSSSQLKDSNKEKPSEDSTDITNTNTVMTPQPLTTLEVDDSLEEATHDEYDWLPDRDKARLRRESSRIYAETVESPIDSSIPAVSSTMDTPTTITATVRKQRSSRRAMGYMGDSTLQDIAMDYSVPICYLADVLCTWGVPPPIDVRQRLGDLVTGEQAFGLVEAVTSLDVADLQDQYSNMNLVQLCFEYDIDLAEAFGMALKEGWSLPFGVQTCLRVTQESELLRVLADMNDDDDEDDFDDELLL
jgi:hypothetical protein